LGSSERFVEIASGHITNRGRADLIKNLPNLIGKTENEHELYHSWYSFDSELNRHLNAKKTISSFRGSYYIDKIILDIDKQSLSDTEFLSFIRYFVNETLQNDFQIKEDHIQVWFSGTGFHIVLPNLFGFKPSLDLPMTVKSTLVDVFPDCDSIYDGARLIRAPFSFNKKSGLFKIPLTLKELYKLSFDDIKKKASTLPKKIDFAKYDFEEVDPYLNRFLKLYVPKPIQNQETSRSAFDMDPSTVVTCMQTVLSKSPVHGETNDTMMRLAGWMRRNGMPREIVYRTLSEWSGNDKEAQSTTNSEFDKGYNYWCDDPIMAKHCDPKCIHFKRKDYSMAIKSAKTLAENYAKFLRDGISEKAFNYKDLYGLNNDSWAMPGELIIILGDTGMGKSTYISNLAIQLNKHRIMYLSLENNEHLTIKRMSQMAEGYTQREINKHYAELKDPKNLYSHLEHIQFAHIPPEIDKLQEQVAYMKPHIVIVDPTDEIHVKGSQNDFDRMNKIIGKLKEIANNQECIVIAVHHINKDSGRSGYVDIHSAKGTSNVVQKADKVFTINGKGTESGRMLYTEKNRDGGRWKVMFEFDKQKMLFIPLPPPSLGDYSK